MKILLYNSLLLLILTSFGVESVQDTSIFDSPNKASHLKRSLNAIPDNQHKPPPLPRTKEEYEKARVEKAKRMAQQRENAKAKIREMMENPNEYSTGKAEEMSQESIRDLKAGVLKTDPKLEKTQNRWLFNADDTNSWMKKGLANPGMYWDKWAQAYRMLGVYVECQNPNNRWAQYNGNNNNDNNGCKRWVIWAAYVNPDYQGFGIDEYVGAWASGDDYYQQFNQYSSGGCQNTDQGYKCFNQQNGQNKYNNRFNKNGGDDPLSPLDCHRLDTNWLLLGVYRENFEDYFEQISKHLWYYSSYEYKIATNGLELLNADCEGYGTSAYGDYLYRAPMPLEGGWFKMGLYTDNVCMTPYEGEEDNYYNLNNNNHKKNNNWNNYYDYYGGGQANSDEETLELFNQVYEEFKYCTLCLDYPSYQDGYFNGDGYDDDDLINQCWKFYSHDTYECDSACIAAADYQGTINIFQYGGKFYGQHWEGTEGKSSSRNRGSSFSRASFSQNQGDFDMLANLVLILGIAAVALFLNSSRDVEGGKFDFLLGSGDDENKKSKKVSLLENGDGQDKKEKTAKGSMFNRIRSAPAKTGFFGRKKKNTKSQAKAQTQGLILKSKSIKNIANNQTQNKKTNNAKNADKQRPKTAPKQKTEPDKKRNEPQANSVPKKKSEPQANSVPKNSKPQSSSNNISDLKPASAKEVKFIEQSRPQTVHGSRLMNGNQIERPDGNRSKPKSIQSIRQFNPQMESRFERQQKQILRNEIEDDNDMRRARSEGIDRAKMILQKHKNNYHT